VVEQRSHEQVARFAVGVSERREQDFLFLPEVRDCFRREEAQKVRNRNAALTLLGLRGLPEPPRCDKGVVMVVRERNE